MQSLLLLKLLPKEKQRPSNSTPSPSTCSNPSRASPSPSHLSPPRSPPRCRASFPSLGVGGALLPFTPATVRVDWKETPAAPHVFKADVPGLRKDEIKLDVEVEDGRVLQISGEGTRERQEKTDTWHRVERSSGKFLKRFRLPENAKVDQVSAAMENGALTVPVPTEEETGQANVRSVEISG